MAQGIAQQMVGNAERGKALKAAMGGSAPDPSKKELQRQGVLIGELFKRLDNLTRVLAAQPAPVVNVAPPEVSVAAPDVRVPDAPVVNVPQPKVDVSVEAPSVNVDVAAPSVSVEAPNVSVQPPSVSIEAPNVTVAAPNVAAPDINLDMQPTINVPFPKRLEFAHTYDNRGNPISTTVTSAEFE